MRFRPSAGPLLASLLWALPGAVALPHVVYAQDAPKSALITAVRGNTLTLAIGTADGAKIGQTFRISHGVSGAIIQITAINAADSTAALVSADPGVIVTVGESATYLGEEPLAAPLPVPNPTPNTPVPVTPVPVIPVAPPQTAAPTGGTGPQQALITAVNGKNVTLGIGSADGAVLGAVYALPLDGGVKARMQITSVRANDSIASLSIIEEGFTPTVGDTTRFIAVETVQLPAPVAPVVTPGTPVAPGAPTTNPTIENPTSPVASTSMTVEPAPVSTLSGSTATVTAIQGQSVVISAGTAQGAKPALNLPILRGGQIIGLLHLQVVQENTSTGTVLWRDESLAVIAPGDAVGIIGAPPSVGLPNVGKPEPTTTVPSTLVQYETGASNESVPKANPTYELLASLAANGLIKSQRASIFQDDGARRHSTQEDIIFSKAQIAGFIKEAISNYDDSVSSKGEAALGILTKDYERDLMKLGETKETLAPFQQGGFRVALSGFSRYTLAGIDTDSGSRDPFEDSYGARRSKTGSDSRNNIFGRFNSRLSFYGSFDYGSDIRNGTGNINEISSTPIADPLTGKLSNLQVRKAYLSYDAGNLVRGLKIDIGRKEFWWGPGQFGTMLLGDAAGGLNSLSTTFERGSYRFENMYAYLGRGPAGNFRSMYGQTVSVKVNNSVRVGTTSTILTPNDKFNPKYFLTGFSPLSLYVVRSKSDNNGNSNDNAVLGGFAEASVAKGARVYGEVMIDDLSLKTVPTIQSRTGSVVGVSVFTPKDPGKAGFKAEYARLNSYSYLAIPNAGNDTGDYYYQFRNSPLGYPITPLSPTTEGGAESLRFESYYSPLKRMRVYAGIEFNDINTGDQDVFNPTVRGLSRQQIRRVAVSYDLSKKFTLTARGQEIRTDQPNFITNEPSQKDHYISLEIARSF